MLLQRISLHFKTSAVSIVVYPLGLSGFLYSMTRQVSAPIRYISIPSAGIAVIPILILDHLFQFVNLEGADRPLAPVIPG
jgi:hypothetical protein